jgi:chloramphenicol 3-O phosphotransferase
MAARESSSPTGEHPRTWPPGRCHHGAMSDNPGSIVILNGAPRSGKSSIATVIQESFEGLWMNLGVDVFARSVTPPRFQPGMGLRPGGERSDIEAFIPVLYAAFYNSVAAHSCQGLNVVVDVGHHDAYSVPRGTLQDAARRLAGLPALLVGVRCALDVIMRRRGQSDNAYEGASTEVTENSPVPAAVLRWQEEVHRPGIYDLEVDTSAVSPDQCARAIQARLQRGPEPTALGLIMQASEP